MRLQGEMQAKIELEQRKREELEAVQVCLPRSLFLRKSSWFVLQERLKDWEQKEAQARAEVAELKSSVAAAARREQEQRNLILELKKDQQAREGKEKECEVFPPIRFIIF